MLLQKQRPRRSQLLGIGVHVCVLTAINAAPPALVVRHHHHHLARRSARTRVGQAPLPFVATAAIVNGLSARSPLAVRSQLLSRWRIL